MANNTLEGNRRHIPRQTGRTTTLVDAIEGTLADFLAAQIAALDAASDVSPAYPVWHQRGVAALNEPAATGRAR